MRLNIVDLTASPTDAALDRQLRLLPNRREAPFKSSIVDRTRVTTSTLNGKATRDIIS